MKKLLIVESPAKIKTIKKFLGNDFTIMSTMGHIKDLPTKRLGVTINGSIDIEYEILENKDKTIADICKAASKSDEIYLAPDPDREGEIIAWHIGQEIEKVAKKGAKIYRIWFNEITKSAVVEAIEHPSDINMDRVHAQQARRVLDRWVGYEVSPVLWKKITPGLSAGRVQSVALRMITEREQEIRAFKPQEYWSIDGTFLHQKEQLIAALTHIGTKKAEIPDKKTADALVAQAKAESYIVESVTDKTRKKSAPAPFMTSSLQQTAFNRLGFSVKRTMQIAQKLYEGVPLDDPSTPTALITYMRTDSTRTAESALKQVRNFIVSNFDKEYLPPKANVYEKKSAGKTQDAHEAIRPVDVTLTPEKVKRYLSAESAKLYDLIWKRFVASQMKPADYAQRQVVIKGGELIFKATGSTLIFDGYLKVYGVDESEEDDEKKVKIPATIAAKLPLPLKQLSPKQHFTQPPPRYTEGSLVKEMEKEGIGRPSTYAAILNTIRARAYTNLDAKKRFEPTELGMAVTKMLVDNLPDIMDLRFTARLEEDLDKVAQHELDRDKLLRDFHVPFQKDLAKFQGSDKTRQAIETDLKCPTCKKEKLSIRFGKTGEFLGCMAYPECSFTSNFKRNEQGDIELVEAKTPELLDQTCPSCDKPLRKIHGRFGEFIACSGYPECKYIHREKADFACPMCGGEVVQKAWRSGKLWGCENYPKCTFAIFDQIEKKACPKCAWPVLARKEYKNGKIVLLCANKQCGHKEEL